MPLILAPLGQEVRIVKIVADDKTKKHLANLGLLVDATVTVLSSADKWYGVTYKEDKEKVATALANIFELDYDTVLKRVNRNSSIETIARKVEKEKADWIKAYQEEKDSQFELLKRIKELEEERNHWHGCFIVAMENGIAKEKVKNVLKNNRNEIFSATYLSREQFRPYEMQIERINKIEQELIGEDK